jgi:hypothetical protein
MIDIRVQDEDGNLESEFGDPQIIHSLLAVAPADSRCLQFIDPYGDTTFNRYQAEVLASELETAAARLTVSGERERASALVGFVRNAATMIHMYVKFIGD